MLRNIHPLLTGHLLDTLRGLRPGQRLAIISSAEQPAEPRYLLDAQIEDAAHAILSVLPVSDEVEAPIEYWLEDADDDVSMDIAHAVVGIARDAEMRPLRAEQIGASSARAATADADLVIQADSSGPATTFVVHIGGVDHQGSAVRAA